MASPESSPQRKEGDEWTMVDRVSELMENGGMSDISLPPLPAFEGPSRDASDMEDQQQEHSAVSDDSASFSEESDVDQRGRAGATIDGARKANARPNVIARRRAYARARGSKRAARAAAAVAEDSSPSSSPARPRRRAGRTERSGRRFDEGPPPLNSASEESEASSSDFSSSSSCASPVIRRSRGAALIDATAPSSDGSRGQGGNGALIPFSLEEITCVASETVSASSSLYGTARGLTAKKQSSPSTWTTGAQASIGRSDGAPSAATAASAAAAAPSTPESSGGDQVCGKDAGRGGVLLGSPAFNGSEEDHCPEPSDVSNLDRCSTSSQLSYSTNYSSAGGASGTARTRTGRSGSSTAGGRRGDHAEGTDGSDRPATELTGSGAWSLSARGMTPLGRLFNAGGAEWGAGSGLAGRATGSLAGFSGYKASVLEARAEAAEEQGEFWQQRASAAEETNELLQKVIASQADKIAELMRQSEAPSSTSSSTPLPTCSMTEGVEECKEAWSRSQLRESATQAALDPSLASGRERKEERQLEAAWASAYACAGAGGMPSSGSLRGAVDAIGGIAFTSFSVGQVAMFFPTPEGNFLAFNVGCPGHFLSKESQELVDRDEHFRPYYVLGRIIEIQDITCEKDNAYKLAEGHQIKVVSVESITPDLKAAGLQ